MFKFAVHKVFRCSIILPGSDGLTGGCMLYKFIIAASCMFVDVAWIDRGRYTPCWVPALDYYHSPNVELDIQFVCIAHYWPKPTSHQSSSQQLFLPTDFWGNADNICCKDARKHTEKYTMRGNCMILVCSRYMAMRQFKFCCWAHCRIYAFHM